MKGLDDSKVGEGGGLTKGKGQKDFRMKFYQSQHSRSYINADKKGGSMQI